MLSLRLLEWDPGLTNGQTQHHGHIHSLLILSTAVWVSAFVPFRLPHDACQCWEQSEHLNNQSFPAEDLPHGQADFLSFFDLDSVPELGDCSRELAGLNPGLNPGLWFPEADSLLLAIRTEVLIAGGVDLLTLVAIVELDLGKGHQVDQGMLAH